ncbi:GNAT family N-acetyltransferase [Acinetobacter silvestris]|uniref:GNAT family N-acetyltransferase n=1 Tax=Acinetobacter silvestris TaxID=1977882 RepID=A0A1Y3CF65_9GAMM|nr:GNAT family N-acetyltransferase [Acinetobacter silvestris]OTG64254.1 GNAT family N-acetyltransferase [Acinetobacter silvestris]
MDFLIRPAQIEDLPQILNIYNTEIINGTATWNHHPKTLADLKIWFEDLTTQQFPLYVAEEKSSHNIAGFADYSAFRSIHGFKQTVEHSVFIHPNFARQGLGKILMLQLIQHAKQHNIHVMVAAIDHANTGSILLHEKLGFKQTGYMPQVGQKFGQWRDLVLLQLILD